MCLAPTSCPVEATRSHSPARVKAGGVSPDPAVVSHELGQDVARGGASVGSGGAPGRAAAPPPPLPLLKAAVKGS